MLNTTKNKVIYYKMKMVPTVYKESDQFEVYCKFPDMSLIKLDSKLDLTPHAKMSHSLISVYKNTVQITWTNKEGRKDQCIVPSEWIVSRNK